MTEAGRQLFPSVHDGFELFSEGLAKVRTGSAGHLRITATNAFAVRWLLPRLPNWRSIHPRLKLEIVGTDRVLDLAAGEADIAIRYARTPPTDLASVELARDVFFVVASRKLMKSATMPLRPVAIAEFPLIDTDWPTTDKSAPTWRRWQNVASRRVRAVPDLASMTELRFHEELHAIEAVIAGQGVAICSNVLVRSELESGALVPVSKISLPGYGFYITYRTPNPKKASIESFIAWAISSMQPLV
jgi:LysR family glycine cleavage system transcriptional activator